MKKVNGTFVGKIKLSLDSKYMHGTGLDEDINKTNLIIQNMQEELKQVLEKYKKQFRMFESAEDLYIEVLREEVIKILKERGEL